MDLIVIGGIVLLLGLWSVIVVTRGVEFEDDEESDRETLPGMWHVASIEQQNEGREPEIESVSPPPGQCPACGAENDPFYTYCRSCAGRLGPS